MIYLDSSVVVCAYLPDEEYHRQARDLLDDPSRAIITGSWTRLEVTSALVRAARAHRGDEEGLLDLFQIDTDPRAGGLMVVDAEQASLEARSLEIVRRHGIRSLDAWHLACADLAFAELSEPGEQNLFATRDHRQAAVAEELGFTVL